jgi:CubicO group peptidase (beta-lactamase class C family)
VVVKENIAGPLGMDHTGFAMNDEQKANAVMVHVKGEDGRWTSIGNVLNESPDWWAGGHGLYSTPRDYIRFERALLRGGELDGVRLLGPRTVAYMTRNHLPGGADLKAFGRPIFAESNYAGVGFGLGVSVVVDPVPGRIMTSTGEFAWGGFASTAFYVDPVEDVTAMFFTQLMPSSTYPLRSQLRALVNQALVD